ncbi:MAG: YitT family protein [Desulfosarcinaceae bacterium]|nr:YitT family protein [Desulfosarcinaceae bacterium]
MTKENAAHPGITRTVTSGRLAETPDERDKEQGQMLHTNPKSQTAVTAAVRPTVPPTLQPSHLVMMVYNLLLLTGGSLLWVLALQWFMVPNNILSGGLLGIAMICSHLYPLMETGWLNLLLNLPLFWLGWRYVGMRFTLYSLFGILVFSLLADLVAVPVGIERHPLWAALGGGLLAGSGGTLLLRSAGTAGGLDIMVVYLRNRLRIRAGRLVMALNGAVLLAGGGLLGLEALLYSLLFLATCSYTIDLLVPRPTAPTPREDSRPGERRN